MGLANEQAEHLLDWFHLTMRLTVLNQTAKGLPERNYGERYRNGERIASGFVESAINQVVSK